MQLVYNNIHENTDIAQKFKRYADSRKTEHHPPQIKLKPHINDDKIVLLDLRIKLPSF